MKKLLLTILMLSANALRAQTSSYYPFPDDSATWCASLCVIQPQVGSYYYEPATYKLNGKVLINGNWYSKMQSHKNYCTAPMFCMCGGLNGSVDTIYYLRQDIAQKKVWIYLPAVNKDTVFLDFNVNIGDTIDGRNAFWAQLFNDIAIVTSIDSVLIGAQYRNRYNYLYQGFPNSMIEGIGPDHGFFNLANKGYDYMTELNIFSQNNQLFFPYYQADTTGMWQHCYEFSTGVKQINKSVFTFSFPNPSSGLFVLQCNQVVSKGNISVYNVMGKKVWSENIFNESEKEIDLKNISVGVYFIEMFDGENYYCRKLIVEHH